METRPFGWCFIGTGTLATRVAEEIRETGRHRIVSTYSRNLEHNSGFAHRCGATPYISALDAITADGVDAVYVVTPHTAHFDAVKEALLFGKPVLCEKPMGVTAQQAEELFRLAAEKKLYLCEAMWTWFAPAANRVKEWVDAGRFGTIQSVYAGYHMNSKRYAPRVTDPMLAGGALLDIGVYPIHYLIRLFGEPTKIVCKGTMAGGIDRGEEIDLTFANGVTARASASIDDFKGLERLAIRGSDASVSLWFFHRANSVRLKKGLKTLDRVNGYGGMANEFDLVAEEIQEGRTTSRFVPPEMTLATLRVADECRRQLGLVYPFEKEN
ncbi:MAG: Gfo/Idh/MocA family oxidoreductase [Clostridia bacterium]|nr:Gfo/Idh/MocA family oxidoreductase [Clostridia bacterium]